MSTFTVESAPHDPYEPRVLRGSFATLADAQAYALRLIQTDVDYWHQSFLEDWKGEPEAPKWYPELDWNVTRALIAEWDGPTVLNEMLVTA